MNRSWGWLGVWKKRGRKWVLHQVQIVIIKSPISSCYGSGATQTCDCLSYFICISCVSNIQCSRSCSSRLSLCCRLTICWVKLSLFSVKLYTVLRFCRAVVYGTLSGGNDYIIIIDMYNYNTIIHRYYYNTMTHICKRLLSVWLCSSSICMHYNQWRESLALALRTNFLALVLISLWCWLLNFDPSNGARALWLACTNCQTFLLTKVYILSKVLLNLNFKCSSIYSSSRLS